MVVGNANALNCYLERDSDRLMGRTVASAPMSPMAPETALWFGIGLSWSRSRCHPAHDTARRTARSHRAPVLRGGVHANRRRSHCPPGGALPSALPRDVGPPRPVARHRRAYPFALLFLGRSPLWPSASM